jgi:hypothetical protein
MDQLKTSPLRLPLTKFDVVAITALLKYLQRLCLKRKVLLDVDFNYHFNVHGISNANLRMFILESWFQIMRDPYGAGETRFVFVNPMSVEEWLEDNFLLPVKKVKEPTVPALLQRWLVALQNVAKDYSSPQPLRKAYIDSHYGVSYLSDNLFHFKLLVVTDPDKPFSLRHYLWQGGTPTLDMAKQMTQRNAAISKELRDRRLKPQV